MTDSATKKVQLTNDQIQRKIEYLQDYERRKNRLEIDIPIIEEQIKEDWAMENLKVTIDSVRLKIKQLETDLKIAEHQYKSELPRRDQKAHLKELKSQLKTVDNNIRVLKKDINTKTEHILNQLEE